MVTRYKATSHGDVDNNDDNNHCLEEQKDAEEGDCGRGSETNSRTRMLWVSAVFGSLFQD